MAFELSRFVKQTLAFNAGRIQTTFSPSDTVVYEGGPSFFTYASQTDSVATISAANYFANVVYDLQPQDLIYISGSDARAFLSVATVNADAGTVTTINALT